MSAARQAQFSLYKFYFSTLKMELGKNDTNTHKKEKIRTKRNIKKIMTKKISCESQDIILTGYALKIGWKIKLLLIQYNGLKGSYFKNSFVLLVEILVHLIIDILHLDIYFS